LLQYHSNYINTNTSTFGGFAVVQVISRGHQSTGQRQQQDRQSGSFFLQLYMLIIL
jgi:hypothetical protein